MPYLPSPYSWDNSPVSHHIQKKSRYDGLHVGPYQQTTYSKVDMNPGLSLGGGQTRT